VILIALIALAMAFRVRGETPPEAGPPRPTYPNLDNILPAQADQALQAYRQALRQWQDDRLAALKASGGAPSVVVPPRPTRPSLVGLTPEQRQTALQSFKEQMDDWRPIYLQASAAEDALKRKAGLLLSQAEMQRIEMAAITLPANYSWRRDAENNGLSSATIGQLDRDSLAIAGPYYRQSFEVYTKNPQPPFVTSDSLLNGFHVLLEDSIRQLELTRVSLLRQALEDAWTSLDARLAKDYVLRAEIEPFARHLALVIGPALRLLGSKVPLGDAELEAAVSGEVKKIEAANTVALPLWLAPADGSLVAIDYRRCRPIGFYAGDPQLAAYYEATRWLQMIPLRASRDIEVGAAGLLADLARDSNPPIIGAYSEPALSQFIDDGAAIFGDADAPAISQALEGGSLLRRIGQQRRPVGGVLMTVNP
jgi:hypothetical protein